MLANTGMVTCYGVPLEFKSAVIGADQPGYRGLVFLSGAGTATLARWTPNAVTVRVTGAGPGERVVYDTSFDPGWRVNGQPAEDRGGLVAGPVAPGDSTVEIRYRPVGLVPGLLLFALTLLVVGWGACEATAWSPRFSLTQPARTVTYAGSKAATGSRARRGERNQRHCDHESKSRHVAQW